MRSLNEMLPLAPPPAQLVEWALESAERQGLQLEFTTIISEAGLLVWCVQIVTERGTLTYAPADLTKNAWLELLNERGLLR
jgi:hypothetical protein